MTVESCSAGTGAKHSHCSGIRLEMLAPSKDFGALSRFLDCLHARGVLD